VHQWTLFARRYKGISNERVSFNLVNERLLPLTPAEKTRLMETRKNQSQEATDRETEALL
jgi:hypothetical protein